MGQKWVKNVLFQRLSWTLDAQTRVFSPFRACVLGHGKSQNALKMGRFGTKNG